MNSTLKITLTLLFLFFLSISAGPEETLSKVCLEEKCFNVELAITNEEKAKGLMFRESLRDNNGMFFVFEEEGIHTFWMKNTKISLDIIWLDSQLKIVHIQENVPPCTQDPCTTYSSLENSSYVLELNAGTFSKNNLDENASASLFLNL